VTSAVKSASAPPRLHREFFKLWAGESISLVGSQITEVALPLTAVLFLHASAATVGFINTARWLPFLLLTLWVGVLADRRRRRPMLVTSDIARAIVLTGIVGLALAHVLSIPLLIGMVFIFGAFNVVFEVSYYSYVPHIVPRSQLVDANSRLQASLSVAQVGGPSLGGLLAQALTAPVALAADAFSFVVSAASLCWIRLPEPVPADHPAGGEWAQIREGLAVTFQNRYLRALAGTSTFYNLFDQWISTLFIVFAVRDLKFSAGLIGVTLSTGAIGALLGSVSTGPVIARLGVGRAVLWSVVVECLALLAVPLAPAREAESIPLLMIAYALNGYGVALSTVAAVTVRQVAAADRLLGRMNASYRFVSYGAIPLGALLGGLAGQWLGLRMGLLAGALALLSTVAWVALSPLPRLRDPAEAAVQEDS
jgi:MFS family permease